MSRQASSAFVEEHPKGSGKHRVRTRIDGKVKTLASGLPLAEAQETADAYIVVSNANELRHGVTVAQFGIAFLERRARKGVRAVKQDGYSWAKHVAADPIGALPVSSLVRRDIVEWLDRRTTSSRGKNKPAVPMHHRTRIKIRNLLRTALAEAVERGLLETNPALEVKVHRSGAATAVDDLEGILIPAEQQALLAAIPDECDRALVAFALCTGLRQAEQWWLEWENVEEELIVVRRSTGGLPPKSGKPREVYLLGTAKAALAATRGRRGFVFKARMGGRRPEGKGPRDWEKWIAAAGITRHITWHDLRHTCATSLLAGWWGRKWSLDEVCRLLGHSSVSVTERYARKLNESQKLAVSATPSFLIPSGGGSAPQVLGTVDESAPFVKHRSSVQVRKSAQSDSTAQNLLDPRSAGEHQNGALWDQNGIKTDLENPRVNRDPSVARATPDFAGWWGPSEPPAAAADFGFLSAQLGGVGGTRCASEVLRA